MLHLPVQQPVAVPDGPHEDRRGVRARRHRVEAGVPDRRVDVLRLVGHQQQRGGLPARIGALVGREEAGRGLADLDDVAVSGAHLAHGQRRALQPIEHPVAGDVGLRGARRRRDDDRAAGVLVAGQQPGDELGQRLVFAGLPGEDDGELPAETARDALGDGPGRAELVAAQPVRRQEHAGVVADVVQQRPQAARRAVRPAVHGPRSSAPGHGGSAPGSRMRPARAPFRSASATSTLNAARLMPRETISRRRQLQCRCSGGYGPAPR